MSRKRHVLEQLNRDELLYALDGFDLQVADRRVRNQLINALAASRRAALSEILGDLKRVRLQEICRALGLDDGGREKALYIERLSGRPPGAAPAEEPPRRRAAPPPEPPPTPRTKAPGRPPATAPAARKLTLRQLERHLFAAADILRGKMDASEFKEYIFGMLFLKRCSDVFEARFKDIRDRELTKGRSAAEAEKRANHPSFYADSFYVPAEARWQHLRDEVHHNVGVPPSGLRSR